MMTTTKKDEILTQLERLDQQHAEQVLAYIKSMLPQRGGTEDYTRFKERAMLEINAALRAK